LVEENGFSVRDTFSVRLDKFLHGVTPVAKLDGDKLGLLVANVAEIKLRR